MKTPYPKKAVTPRVGDQRVGEPKQSPTPGSFAGLVSREEVIAKPRTQTADPLAAMWAYKWLDGCKNSIVGRFIERLG
jgi:hypothetical protein